MEHPLDILLVDDEEIVHQTIGDYLSDCGHRVDRALDGPSALEAVESSSYDLAFVDVRMPGIDGISLLTRFREHRPEMPVVIITGHGNVEMADEALRLGAVELLVKPIRLLDLDAILEKVTGPLGSV